LTVLLAFVAAALAVGAAIYLAGRKRKPPTPPQVRIEFWVYSTVEDRPSDSEILKRVLGENPHRARLGKKEGLVLSDIRFHIGRVRPDSNPYLFRPDALAEPDADVPDDIGRLLDNTVALFRVSYISETAIDSTAALSFAWHSADAINEAVGSRLVFDTVAQRFWPERSLYDELHKDPNAVRYDLNVVVRWTETPQEGTAFTRGMSKMGLPDIEMHGVPPDHKTVALFLVESASRRLWDEGWLSEVEIEGFGEVFGVKMLEPHPERSGRRMISEVEAVRKIRG
jgi:hypothetical protein